jgi:hypothetical protein
MSPPGLTHPGALYAAPSHQEAAALGFLTRLFRATSTETTRPRDKAETRPAQWYGGDETLEVVGESFHQDTLWALVGGRTTDHVNCEVCARLVPEPHNPKDRNAIMVLIDGEPVGHLSRHDAAVYLPGLLRLMEHGPVELSGAICGGGQRRDGIGFLGVFLDHNPQDFQIPRTGYRFGRGEMMTGFSEAVETDVEDDSYDLSWHAELSDDHATAAQQLRRMLDAEDDPIDRHYMMSELASRLYKCRDTDPAALDAFDTACEEHHAEMVTIRAALFDKFGVVPVIQTYRQAVIRCQKAKDWARMREWAERGITVYGEEAGRPEVVEDLHKRLAYAVAKIEAPATGTTRRVPPRSRPGSDPVVEKLVCTRCGTTFARVRTRGRKPHLCSDCRGGDAT